MSLNIHFVERFATEIASTKEAAAFHQQHCQHRDATNCYKCHHCRKYDTRISRLHLNLGHACLTAAALVPTTNDEDLVPTTNEEELSNRREPQQAALLSRAEHAFEEAMAIRQQASSQLEFRTVDERTEDAFVARALHGLAKVCQMRGDWRQARALLEEVLCIRCQRISSRSGGSHRLDLASALCDYATVCRELSLSSRPTDSLVEWTIYQANQLRRQVLHKSNSSSRDICAAEDFIMGAAAA